MAVEWRPRRLIPRMPANWLRGLGPAVPVLLVSLLGIALSLYAFAAWRTGERTTDENNFKIAATLRLAELRRSIAKPFDSMHHIETLIEAVGPVDQTTFTRFASVILHDNPAIVQLIWAPLQTSVPGTPFHSPARLWPDGLMASYVLPSDTGKLVGRDFGDVPGYGACLNKAAEFLAKSNRLCVLPLDGGIDILVILAVEHTSTNIDGTALVGAIAGRFHLQLAEADDRQVAIEIFDLATPAGTKLLRPDDPSKLTAYSITEAGGIFRDLRFGSETWRLAGLPMTQAAVSPSRGSLVVLAACLTMTANLAYYILVMLRRRKRIEAIVGVRTVELETALSGLRLSEQRMQDYVATASDWYWETNDDMRFIRVAAEAREHRIEPGDLIGLDRLTEDDAENEIAQRREILIRHQMFRDIRYDYATDRDLLTLSLSGMPIFDANGTFQGYRGSARDITLQLQVEAKQRLARWTAEEASRAKSTFLATMSHEIRTPMNGILGMVQMLSDTALDQEQRRMCDVIYRSGTALQQILNDILDYSKLEAGKITLELIGSSLTDIVASVVDLMRGTAEARGLALDVEVADSVLPTVMVDPTRFRQVLFNLVSNAIKFSERGVVSIRLHGVPVGLDQLAVTLEIADQGIGISEAAQRRLFARFSQADGSTTRRFGGTGLGLAITRELVTLMGGTIAISSEVGQGSVFTVLMTLPFGESIDGPITPPRWTGQVADAKVLDILIAEDNEINQEVISGLLRGHRLTVVGDGRAAVEAVQQSSFDVILMDVMMPDMNGLEATAAIRALPLAVANLPIIALTANSMSGDQERYLAAGMSGYVSKPIERQHLFEVIEQVTGVAIWRPIAAEVTTAPTAEPTEAVASEVDDFLASLQI